MNISRRFTREEERASAIMHGLGIPLSIVALILLWVKAAHSEDNIEALSYVIFGGSLFIMYTMSTLYHSLPRGRSKRIFERLDHCSIYILIAGTYTPFCLVVLKGNVGTTLLTVQWGLALIGLIFKFFWIDRWVAGATVVYALMGWSIIFLVPVLMKTISFAGFIFLLSGGILYTVGIFFFALPLFKYHHGVWHLFVLAGSVMHFLCVYLYL